MTARRHMYAMFGAATLLVAGSAFGEEFFGVNANVTTATTTAAPLIEIVVYDGATLPATVVAGCSEPDCMGYAGPLTGTVTHPKNYVGWSIAGGDPKGSISLYVDGKRVDSARSTQLLVWSASNFSAGPHTLKATASSSVGGQGWSKDLTITVVK